MAALPLTVAGAILGAARRIEISGHAALPRREAEDLLAHVLGKERAWLFGHGEEPLVPADAAAFDSAVARRAAGEPVAYVVGHAPFCGRSFAVSPAVLIPRPETEMIVELAREEEPRRIADVGTGSGCLAVTLALEHRALVVAVDVSPAALEVAAANAARLGARVAFVCADALAPFAARALDLVVANPPYVDPGDRDALPVEVRDHEPAAALYSRGGTEHIAAWLAGAVAALRPGGRLLFEIGFGQEAAVRSLAASHERLGPVRVHPDFQGIPRVLDARVRP